MNPWVLAGPAGIATSMAFIMVTSSPTNVIPYSSGYFRISDFAKSGVFMTIIAILCVTFSVAVFGKFAGWTSGINIGQLQANLTRHHCNSTIKPTNTQRRIS